MCYDNAWGFFLYIGMVGIFVERVTRGILKGILYTEGS